MSEQLGNEQRNLIVGFDLCDDFSQLSYYNYKTYEPESVCVDLEGSKYLIPTALGVKNYSKDWVFGEEAVSCGKSGTGVLVDDLLNKLKTGENIEIFGTEFDSVSLMEKYLRKCLLLLKKKFPANTILQIIITLKELDEKVVTGLYQALENLGIGKDRGYIQSHSHSYQYYALSQSKELWMNDIGLFDFDEKGLVYSQISINHRTRPYVVGIKEEDFSETLSYAMLEEYKNGENLEYIFGNIANSVLHKQIVSTIYATGLGFEDNWADNILKELCVGRRIFKGQNLYVKGACYAARELAGGSKLSEYLFLSKEMIKSDIFITGYYNGKTADVVLVKAGKPWYEINSNLDVILDDEQEIIIKLKSIISGEIKEYVIRLDGFPQRPGRTTRVGINIKFKDHANGVITLEDKGFGSFYPSSGYIEEVEIVVQ
ncbi:hypothetical protein GCM10023142_09980 [Anaerocolumna aminovalerica]|jgi:hypothetical protein|uniref:DUF5716 domain-containing protein n=1 Tax=Anaerocolumna aminovalerica TaxID=1527 RepID=A0A1I5E135_9FIRM|nr:DUF5716 family protein [Anaerocolumna aminovalerica]SFO05225.1 hypothetical protein SAMN04489757_107121 [Anaerocolumna aminovalerica]